MPMAPSPDHTPRRWRTQVLLAAIIAGLAAAAWWGAYRYFVDQEIAQAEGRLSLYRSTVWGEVDRFEHLTQILALDPFVRAQMDGGDPAALNARLEDVTDAAGIDAIFLMDLTGLTIAASNAAQPGSFLGETYGFRPYFREALSGERGRFYGIGATTGNPGYFIADPVRGDGGAIAGVIALKIDLVPFEQSWRAAGEQVLLADANGVVLLASDPAWRYRTLDPLSQTELDVIAEARQFTGQTLAPLDWQDQGQRARIDGAERLHLVSNDLPHGWQLHYLAPDDRAVTRAWLAAGGIVVLSVLALLYAQVQRGERLGRALRVSEEQEAGLRATNARLAQEIDDRRRAERRLQETRAELERTSRLAALGQLAASVTHELGQPIAAMRNHLTAHEMAKGSEPRLTSRLGGLVDRMEGITRQLKFFARSGDEGFEDIDLLSSVTAVLDLLAPRLEDGVALRFDPPDRPVMARGARLRLEQVLTNLMRNALDAMEETDTPELSLRFGEDDETLWLEISDTGHGLGETTLAELQEPFFTTRESGQGMGLGLAISAGILEDHGGRLEARNRDGGGAAFWMILPRPKPQELAAQ